MFNAPVTVAVLKLVLADKRRLRAAAARSGQDVELLLAGLIEMKLLEQAPDLTRDQRDAIFAAPWNRDALASYCHDERESVALMWKFTPDGRMDLTVGLQRQFRKVNRTQAGK